MHSKKIESQDISANMYLYLHQNRSSSIIAGGGRKETGARRSHEKAQDTQKEEEEGSKRASEASVGICPVLPRHAGRHQGSEPERHLWRSVQDCGIHVGRSRGGAETGTPNRF